MVIPDPYRASVLLNIVYKYHSCGHDVVTTSIFCPLFVAILYMVSLSPPGYNFSSDDVMMLLKISFGYWFVTPTLVQLYSISSNISPIYLAKTDESF